MRLMRHGSSLSQSLDLDDDCLGVKVLVEDLFPETTRAYIGSEGNKYQRQGIAMDRDIPSLVVPMYPYLGVSWRSRSHVPYFDPSWFHLYQ